MRTQLLIGAAAVAMLFPGAAYAQSTGSTDFEGDIVITSTRAQGVGGVQIPDSPKAKGVLTQEFISRQTPGNSILDTINSLPGVSFQNNDPFGSAGGTLTIRGFDATRIGLTFDGVPLNDTGNYALYSNQQLDPELIQQVNVSYGSTDVDSPTAAASGSTVNYTTIVPTDDFGARLQGSIGDYNFFRVFGLLNTGRFTSFGTKAWISASNANNDVVFNNFGKIRKSQYNARIYQPIGSNGDFVSLAGNYNVNRNNFFGSAPLRIDTNVFTQTGTGNGATPGAPGSISNPILNTGALRTAGTGSNNRFPLGRDELPYPIARCLTTPGGPGAQSPGTITAPGASNNATACGSSFDERYNPSNTGSIRFGSKFTLAKGLVFTADASFQYVKANGGGTVTGRETVGFTQTANAPTNRLAITTPLYGFVGGSYYFGRDLNGDGDSLDQVTLLAPSQTVTHRYGLITSLRYDIDSNNTLRIAYSHDYGRHRQTGELNQLAPDGYPTDVFPINNPLRDTNGFVVEKRDRLSFAILDQVAGEYRGTFGNLTASIGVRAPFFVRKLNNYCFTTSATGFVDCFGRGNTAANNTYATANPYSFNATTGAVLGYAAPQSRTYRYNRVLPNVGLTYKFGGGATVYVNYSKGLQVPGTDNLYNAFFYPVGSSQATPTPETSDNFDAGFRYTTSKIQAFVGPWYTRFTNRLASAFDPDSQTTVYRNLGRVDKYGIDGSISYKPIPEIVAYVFGSYMKSEIKNNVLLGNCTVATTANCTTVGAPIYALTAGKRESGAPVYSFGARLQGTFGPVELAVQAKRTGPRYVNDQNLPNLGCTSALVNQICPTAAVTTPTTFTGNTPTGGYVGTRGFQYQVYGAEAPAYTTVDLDARVSLEWLGLNKTTYFQFNVQNVFNKFYVGGFTGGATTQYSVPFVQIGSPRAFIGTLNVQF